MPQTEDALLARITVDPEIFGGKPIVRGRRLAVEHILGMLAAGDPATTSSVSTRGSNATTCWPAWYTPGAAWLASGWNWPSRPPAAGEVPRCEAAPAG